jgi:ABC-2 type transport system permease protein
VPVSFLPDWMRPVSRVVFLSWSADLLRDALRQPDVRAVPLRLSMILLLGAGGHLVGRRLLRGVLRRVRTDGSAGWA